MIYLIAIIFPWLAFMLRGDIGLGILCLILQITLIGWLPATIWAIIHISNQNAEKRNRQMLVALKEQQFYQKKQQLYQKPHDYLTIEEKARLFDERNQTQ